MCTDSCVRVFCVFFFVPHIHHHIAVTQWGGPDVIEA